MCSRQIVNIISFIVNGIQYQRNTKTMGTQLDSSNNIGLVRNFVTGDQIIVSASLGNTLGGVILPYTIYGGPRSFISINRIN